MQDLSGNQVAELHSQIAFASSVFGGFAIAFLGALLPLEATRRAAIWAIGFTCFAAVFFVVSTFSSTFLFLMASSFELRSFDYSTWPSMAVRIKYISDIAFFLGIFTLLLGLGTSGWTRSRRTGQVTTTAVSLGILLLAVVIWGTF